MSLILESLHKLWSVCEQPGQWSTNVLRLGSTDPLVCSVLVLLTLTVVSYVLNLLTSNYSWVDRLWSITPPVYSLIFAWFTPATVPGAQRVWMAAGLISLWGIRLSFNFYRKGGYSPSEEDYRWRFVRSFAPNRFLWELFNLGFICIYQHALLWSLTLPVYLAAVQGKFIPVSWQDYAVAGLFAGFVLMETMADQQQWNFHQLKQRKRSRSGKNNNSNNGDDDDDDLRRGFLTGGLFRYSRHPNFFAEQSIWWTVYLFSLTSARVGGIPFQVMIAQRQFDWQLLVNFTAIGPLLLTLLFQGSTELTEWISTGKYADYRNYQKTTSRLIPWFPSSSKPLGKKTATPRRPRAESPATNTPRRSSPRRAKQE